MSSYYIVRVNTDDHATRALAMADMAAILERRGYWKKSVRPDMPVGSPVIAVGGHGGRGLFLHGIVRGDWKKVKGGAEGNPTYQHKLPMAWDNTVYMHPESDVNLVLHLAGIQGMPPILRAHSRISHDCYRKALAHVLSGQAINPWMWEEEEVAA